MTTYLIEPKPSLDDLAHHGVKGMHWGVRRNEPTNSAYSQSRQVYDKDRFGKGGVKRINRRLNKGKTYKQAVRREGVSYVSRRAALVGATYVGLILAQHGDQISRELGSRISQKAQTNRGRAAMADLRGLAEKTAVNYIKPNRKGVYNITDL
jgi:hypothetical protein